jgi:hypothetical protein
MSHNWNLYFSSYLIWDGWGHIRAGQELRSIGLQFWSRHSLRNTIDSVKSAIPVRGFEYSVGAEIVFRSDNACVIDFGLKAVNTPDSLLDGANRGDYVVGEICLSLDRSILLPEEIEFSFPHYKWQVQGITADVTPYISHPADRRALVRDESRLQYVEVQSTTGVNNEWERPTRESVRGGFFLQCKLLDNLGQIKTAL